MRNTSSRRKSFRAALALSGLTQAQWAEKNGYSAGHVSFVLSGDRVSKRLLETVDAFIATVLPRKAA